MPYLHGLSKEKEAAVLVTAFKQGGNNMKRRFLENRKNNPNSADPIRPGEGLRMFHNIETIHDILYTNNSPRYIRPYFFRWLGG